MVYICINWTSRQIKACVCQVERRLKAYTYTAILFGSRTRRSKYSHIFDRVRVLKSTFYNHHTARLPFARPVVINVYGHLVLIWYAQKAYIQPFCLDRVGTESIYTSCHLPDPSWSRTGSRMR